MVADPPLILNVDDVGANRYVLSRVLSQAGFQIKEAGSGSEALRLLTTSNTQPDLVLLDVHLPDIDGFEVCRRIKSDPHLAHIPVLQHSARYIRTEERVRGLDGGADAYLVSPVDPSELVANVRALLRAREASEREARLREVLDTAGVAILDWNLATDQVDCTPNAALLLDLDPSQFDGRFDSYRHQIHPEDARRLEAVVQQAHGSHDGYTCDFRVLRDGEPIRWITENGLFASDDAGKATHLTRVLTDVTERRAAEEALRTSNERFRVALSHAPISVHTVDRSLRYTWAYQPMNDRPIEEIIGRRDDELFPEPAATALMALKQRVLDSGVGERVDITLETSTGERTYDLTIEPMRSLTGEVSGLTVAAWDQTTFRDITRQLREANVAKDQALATVAHELRNPLTAIRNAVYILNRSESDAASRTRALAVIERQVNQQARLIEDLLDVARLGRGKLDISREPVDFCQLVRATLADLGSSSEAIPLRSDFPAEPVWVLGEAARLTQIVSNLLDNALKFTPPAGTVSLSLQADLTNQVALLTIQDTGIGMDSEFAPQAFDTFAQQEAGHYRRRGGLGLGLALVRGLARLHGGDVTAYSDGPGTGSTFTVTLPLLGEADLNSPAE